MKIKLKENLQKDSKNEKNILILSAGRRVELVNFAKNTLCLNNIKGKVLACDMNPNAPAMFFADGRYTVPPIKDVLYVDEIIRISKENQIDIIIPTIDTELLSLAIRREEIQKKTGAIINISSEKVISICRDKTETARFLGEHGFDCPETYSVDNVVFPAFIKPAGGSSSINANKIDDFNELNYHAQRTSCPIIQQFIQGDEYTVDVFSDFNANPITIVPRRRLEVRSGEIIKGYIVKDRIIIDCCKRLIKELNLWGHNTIQCIKSDNKVYIIEINARFGGGAPMSLRAGADSIMNLVRLSNNETLSYTEEYRNNLYCTRFDDSIFFDDNGDRVYL